MIFDLCQDRFLSGVSPILWMLLETPGLENPKPEDPVFSAHSTRTFPALKRPVLNLVAPANSTCPVATSKAATLQTGYQPIQRSVIWEWGGVGCGTMNDKE